MGIGLVPKWYFCWVISGAANLTFVGTVVPVKDLIDAPGKFPGFEFVCFLKKKQFS